MTESSSILRRYTDLSSLLNIVKRRAITLLPPSSWDDRNDRLMMETYRNYRKLKTLLALCLTSRGETYHHWKVFTNGSHGVCIHFHRSNFIQTMLRAGVEVKEMDYKKFGDLDADAIPPRDLPFIKRLAFKDEGEVRAIYENIKPEVSLKSVEINLNLISRVTLNPWMPAAIAESVVEIIESLAPPLVDKVSQSELIESPTWKKFAAKYGRTELTERS